MTTGQGPLEIPTIFPAGRPRIVPQERAGNTRIALDICIFYMNNFAFCHLHPLIPNFTLYTSKTANTKIIFLIYLPSTIMDRFQNFFKKTHFYS
jgi:hypothetical protein